MRNPYGSSSTATAVWLTAAATSLLLLTGCGKAKDYAEPGPDTSPSSGPSPSATPSYGVEYLALHECAAPESGRKGIYREVACGDSQAVAKVAGRFHDGHADPFEATSCPEKSDFAIDVSAGLAALEGTPPSGEGYACMRNLRPPHPGDPGGGGGPGIQVGDCVHTDPKADNAVHEVACTEKGKDRATHRVRKILLDIAAVPGGLGNPCEYDEAVITINSMYDSDPVKNDKVLCATKL
ncbi:hypothetical protein [Streptomyces sp. NPDC051286]|uniref:hypothetical protein n=1 Tax=Streptomyces sp. NPDC051286 TaxID=3365647 RepID=UPI0037935F12